MLVVAALCACGGASTGGSGSTGPRGLDAGFTPPDAGPAPSDAGSAAADAGMPADAGPGAVDGGTAADDCPRSFDPIPATAAPPQIEADPDAGALMKPVWELRAPAGFRLDFEGLVDSAGNLFWLEQSESNVAVASADKNGVLRFRVTTKLSGFATLYLAGDSLVALDTPQGEFGVTTMVTGSLASATGFSTTTGAVLWTTDLEPIVRGWDPPPPTGTFRPRVFDVAIAGTTIVIAATGFGAGGLIAVDAPSGSIDWSERTSTDGVSVISAVLASRNGTLLAFLPKGDTTQLAHGPVDAPPSLVPGALVAPGLAAPGPLFLTLFSPPSLLTAPQLFCQSDGRRVAQFDSSVSAISTKPFTVTTPPDDIWLQQATALILYDADTGKLVSRFDANLPRFAGEFGELHAQVTTDTALLWIDQTITFPRNGTSADRQQGPPTLHVFRADGREVRKRALPLEAEAYTGVSASSGDRVFLGGEIRPSAGAFGVIRAFDIPGWSTGMPAP